MKKKIDNEKLKEDMQKLTKESKSFWDEFKTFIQRGNVMDLAVGVIIGTSFGSIVTSLVNDIFTPLLGAVVGTSGKFSELSFTVGESIINYGSFIQSVLDFLIMAFFVFLFVKLTNNLLDKFKKKEEEKTAEAPKKSDEVLLLEEIRDLMKRK